MDKITININTHDTNLLKLTSKLGRSSKRNEDTSQSEGIFNRRFPKKNGIIGRLKMGDSDVIFANLSHIVNTKSVAFTINLLNSSATMRNMNGDRGSPYLRPRPSQNSLEGLTLTKNNTNVERHIPKSTFAKSDKN